MVNFPSRIPDCDSHSPALLDLFFSSEANICSTMGLPPLKDSDQIIVSVSIDFCQTQKGIPRFIAYIVIILVLIGAAFVIV